MFVLKKYFTRSLRSLVKYFSALEEKFLISARPCNILSLSLSHSLSLPLSLPLSLFLYIYIYIYIYIFQFPFTKKKRGRLCIVICLIMTGSVLNLSPFRKKFLRNGLKVYSGGNFKKNPFELKQFLMFFF